MTLIDRDELDDLLAHLVGRWISALEGVKSKLERGAKVADVGCGLGASTIAMARAYPASSFFGFEADMRAVEVARRRALEQGVAARAFFAVATGIDYPGTGYDLVAQLDCRPEMGDGSAAARHVRKTLAADGTWMLLESPGACADGRLRAVALAGGFTRFRRTGPFDLVLEARP